MLTVLETRSARVKGISFHPSKPWILAALHNGIVQLWDFRMSTLLEKFEEHDGPVRGVDFHPSQPLFASGGDDYKVRVWNYKLRRCLFTLTGHLDYIRTVQFHPEQPWLMSASDDQTIRIWNWQGRSCVANLTGHNHYVMTAFFHQKEDMVVSASLDQTIRVWDISGLKKQKSSVGSDLMSSNINQELFGTSEVVLKVILEGHEKGVNWAQFHPVHPLIVSGADDRSVRIWKIDETRGFEIEQLRGHVANVCCVSYFKDFVVSNSEDKSIRVWDVKQRSAIHTFRRENDRFWVLATHTQRNLVAAGHDSGLVVFKLERERPAHCIQGNMLYWVGTDRIFRSYDFETGKEESLLQLRRNTHPPFSMSFASTERTAIFYYKDAENYEMYQLPRSGLHPDTEVKKGFYTSVAMCHRSKFACLDKSRQVAIRDTKNDIAKVFHNVGDPGTQGNLNQLFPAASGQFLLGYPDKVSLFDLTNKRVIAECLAPRTKYVVWGRENKEVALLSRDTITVATRKLRQLCVVRENSRIKGAAFDENGVLLFTTLNHLKYCLPQNNGDVGIIQTLQNPIYLMKVVGSTVSYLDREGKVGSMEIDTSEYRFKVALAQNNLREVTQIMQKSSIHGQALVAYLHKHNHPEVAMFFVKDEKTRFHLAIECENLNIALDTVKELKGDKDEEECWNILADAAMKQGKTSIAEQAYTSMGEWDKLLQLYLFSGCTDKIRGVLNSKPVSVHTRLKYAMMTDDYGTMGRILNDVKQTSMAEAAAAQLPEPAEVEEGEEPEEAPQPSLIIPSTAVWEDWPLLGQHQKTVFDMMVEDPNFISGAGDEDIGDSGAWGGDDLDLDDEKDIFGDEEPGLDEEKTPAAPAEPDAWGQDENLFDDEDETPLDLTEGESSDKPFPIQGRGPTFSWTQSHLPVDHIAAGQFENAKNSLTRLLGVTEFGPLKPYFMNVFAAATGCISSHPSVPARLCHLNRPAGEPGMKVKGKNIALPALGMSLNGVSEKMDAAHEAFKGGKFVEAQDLYHQILCSIPFVVVGDKGQVNQLQELLTNAREYLAALRLESTRREKSKDDVKTQLELAAYFTRFALQPGHVSLTLKAAMVAFYKGKNFGHAADFATSLLQLNPPQAVATQARQVIARAKTNNNTNEVSINYDERNPFVVCGSTLQPIYRGEKQVRCSYCYQVFKPECAGATCTVCKIGQVDGTTGSMCSANSYD